MNARVIPALVAAISLQAGGAAAQSSEAARYLLQQNLVDACSDAGGQIDPNGLVETDLDGDGRDDLLISHEKIQCKGGGTRSMMCGAQVCSVRIYLRRGPLLSLEHEILGGGVSVDRDSTPPVLTGHGHGGGSWTLRWKQDGFR